MGMIRPQSKRAKDRFGKDDVEVNIWAAKNHHNQHLTHLVQTPPGTGGLLWLQENVDFIFVEEAKNDGGVSK